MKSYYSSLICKHVQPGGGGSRESAFDREEFGIQARDMGHYVASFWSTVSYVIFQKYPNVKERFCWNWDQAVKWAPHVF
jgi:hypothetical protein